MLSRHAADGKHCRERQRRRFDPQDGGAETNHAPSRSAALRLGYTLEGIFRQHMIIKGKNRDTAWYSMLDGEWSARRADFERWLDPANFDAAGNQRTPLRRI